MSRSSRRFSSKSDRSAPQPAQLDAVRRLSRQGRHSEALSRVRALRAAYPDARALHSLAWELATEADAVMEAVVFAWDWSEAARASTRALEALQTSAEQAGFSALAASAAARAARLQDGAAAVPPPYFSPFGDLTPEQAADMDLATALLNTGRFAEAIERLKAVDHPSAHNNRALAEFCSGRIPEAMAGFAESWRREPRNLFAVTHLLRLRLWTGDRAGAEALAEPLQAAVPVRGEDALAQVAGLLLLGRFESANRAWEAAAGEAYWSKAATWIAADFAHLGAVAAVRVGRLQLAEIRVEEALTDHNGYAPVEALSTRLHEHFVREALSHGHDDAAAGDTIPVVIGEFGAWFPDGWRASMRDLVRQGNGALERWAAAHCDAHSGYLGLAAELGDELTSSLALIVLQQRAKGGEEAAAETLRALLTRPCGPDATRSALHAWLAEAGLVDGRQPVPVLAAGVVGERSLRNFRITSEPTPSDLPAADQKLNDKLLSLFNARNFQAAQPLAERLYGAHPDHPMVIGNLAAVKRALGHPPEEVEALYRHVHELAPDYLFATVALAVFAAERGELDTARELIASVLDRDEYHVSEWRAVLRAQHLVAVKEGDLLEARQIKEMLDEFGEKFG